MVRLLLTGFGATVLGIAGVLGLTGVEAGGGGCHSPLTDEPASRIEIVNSCYGPTVARVETGGTVTWTNRDAALHNVYASGQGWSDGRSFDKGASVSARFDREGVFPYVCTYHPGMVGVVVVGNGMGPAAGAVVPAATTDLPGPDATALLGPASVPLASTASGDDGGRTAVWAGVAALGSAVGTGAVALGLVRRRR